jgi:hypothetical protein
MDQSASEKRKEPDKKKLPDLKLSEEESSIARGPICLSLLLSRCLNYAPRPFRNGFHGRRRRPGSK